MIRVCFTKLGYIYALVHPETGLVRYVGQTSQNPTVRIESHFRTSIAKCPKTPISCWIRSLLRRDMKPAWFILEICQLDRLDHAEIYWIAAMKMFGMPLMNVTDGGLAPRGYKRSRDAVEKTASWHRGRIRSEEHRARQSAALKGRRPSEKCMEASRAVRLGKKLSTEHLQKMSEALRGRKLTSEHIEKVRSALIGRKISSESIEKAIITRRATFKELGSGVCKTSNGRKWRAYISCPGQRQQHLGSFETIEEARACRADAENRLWR